MKLFLCGNHTSWAVTLLVDPSTLYDSFSLARKIRIKTMPALKHSRRTFEKLPPLCIPFHSNFICSRLYHVYPQVPVLLVCGCDALNVVCALQLNVNVCPVQHVQGLQRLVYGQGGACEESVNRTGSNLFSALVRRASSVCTRRMKCVAILPWFCDNLQ